MRFEFATASRIVFGPGTLDEIGRLVGETLPGQENPRALLVCGRSAARAGRLVELLQPRGIDSRTFSMPGEPTIDAVYWGTEQVRHDGCSLVISFGGGSAIDAGKAIAALATNPGDTLDYLEVIGHNKPLTHPPLPVIAIPTTAGTGSEVTRNAVLTSTEHRVKVSLRSPLMLPRLALVDPELTLELPKAVTASTGLDALTQLIEPYVSARANPTTDGICREGIQRAARALPRVYQDAWDADAREEMCIASLFGGLALANAGLGAVHGLAGPIGGRFNAPHGEICAALLPHVMAVNLRALQKRQPGSNALARYAEIARLVTCEPLATAEDGVSWIRELCASLSIKPLREQGISTEDFAWIVERVQVAGSTKGNPIALASEELTEALAAAF
ncbi:MAG: iron-containing alcohol dehydrogenase [Phycisphaerae bacterium]|nr:iron-containing alcohol dehydrogenase [Phycisphaerae bacterium]